MRVNAVALGPTETGMLNRFTGTAERKAALLSGVPIGRIGQPDEIARAILFLASVRDRPDRYRRRRQDCRVIATIRTTLVQHRPLPPAISLATGVTGRLTVS